MQPSELLAEKQYKNFVPAEKNVRLEVLPPYETTVRVEHPTRQEVIVHTSAVDRSKGFQIAITPVSVVVAILAVLVGLAFENELFSFVSVLIFWLVFAIVYVAGWVLTALATPEFVSWYSAKRQWDIIEREQQERWSHYKWQSRREG